MRKEEFDLEGIEILYERYRESEGDFKACREDFFAAVEKAVATGASIHRLEVSLGVARGFLATALKRRER